VKVHHLNCGSMDFPGSPLICHVLLVETDRGLLLVDTGFGLGDIADPGPRLGAVRRVIRPVLSPEESAVRQVERLGFTRDDVRHIVLTHLDLDHIGGLSDFPEAVVHLTSAEVAGGMRSPTRRERLRFRPAQWAHGPTIVEHPPDGEAWRGFAAARPLDGVDPGVVMVSLPGHTRGSAAVAVDAGDRWILHAGDAFYHRGTLDGHSHVPLGLRIQEAAVAHDRRQVRANHDRLAELYRRAEPDLVIVCAHDPVMWAGVRPEPRDLPA
jgi:glyoxylase-like metal-dependent hydrolase (beta-lactamase superfamily II)